MADNIMEDSTARQISSEVGDNTSTQTDYPIVDNSRDYFTDGEVGGKTQIKMEPDVIQTMERHYNEGMSRDYVDALLDGPELCLVNLNISERATVNISSGHLDLQRPKQATVNISSGQIDEQTFICLTCGVKFRTTDELHEHLETKLKALVVAEVKPPGFLKINQDNDLKTREHSRPGFTISNDLYICSTAQKCDKCRNRRYIILGVISANCSDNMGPVVKEDKSDTPVAAVNGQSVAAGPFQGSFKCQYCHEGFSEKHIWAEHERVCERERPYKCQRCNKTFRCRVSWQKHKLMHVSKTHTCIVCNKVFKQELAGHQKVKKCHTCSNCDNEVKHHDSAAINVRSPNYHCQFCKRRFRNEDNCKKHECGHNIACKFCGKGFAAKKNMKKHERLHTGDLYTCRDCDRQFIYVQSLVRHQQVSRTLTEGNECSICGERFARLSCFTYHKSKHACDGIIMALRIGNNSVNGDGDRAVVNRGQAVKTEVKYFKKSRRRNDGKHGKDYEDANSPFTCRYCNKQLKYKGDLVRHEYGHTGKHNFECHVCQKHFTVKRDLLRHAKSHLQTKPYKCQFCDKRFARKDTAVSHERIHTGQNIVRSLNKLKFVCQFCDKKFYRRDKLVFHERIHTGEKPCLCSVCGKTFKRPYEVIAHQRIHDSKS